MATYTAIIASGSTNGKPVKVAAVATAGTLIHTYSAAGIDEVTVKANNTSTTDVTLTIELGDAVVGSNIVCVIPAKAGEILVVAAHRMNTGTVKAFASVTNVINVTCEVNNIV